MKLVDIDNINTSIYKEFNKHNIEIPFPQRTVHLKIIYGLNKKEWFKLILINYLTHGNLVAALNAFESKIHWQNTRIDIIILYCNYIMHCYSEK